TTAAAPAVAAAAAAARGALARFADVDRAPLDLATRQRLNRLRCLVVAAHLDEREAAGSPGVAIHDDLHLDDVAAVLGEHLAQLGFSDVVRQVSYIEPGSHLVLLGSLSGDSALGAPIAGTRDCGRRAM